MYAEPAVHKPLSVDGPDPPSAELSGQTKLDDAYVDWREPLDLSHIRFASPKRHIREVLEKHTGMYTGKLGTVKETEHRIDLYPNLKQIRQQPYSASPKSLEVLELHIETQLDAGIIEPAQTEWESLIILAPKKDGTMRFCVDFRRLNAATIADT